jgi:hypothetical protein
MTPGEKRFHSPLKMGKGITLKLLEKISTGELLSNCGYTFIIFPKKISSFQNLQMDH